MLGWGPASFVVLFVLSLRRLVMRASYGSSRSVGLRIEWWSLSRGKLAADSMVLPLWLSGPSSRLSSSARQGQGED